MYSAILAWASFDDWPVAAVDRPRVAKFVGEPLQRSLVRPHRALRRCDDDRTFTENDVAGEERARAGQVENDVIEGVSGRVHCAQRDITDAKSAFEFEVAVVRDCACRMRVDRRAAAGRQQGGCRRVVGMSVGDRDGRGSCRPRELAVSTQRFDVARDGRARIDDERRVAAIDDVGVRSAQRHRGRIGRA